MEAKFQNATLLFLHVAFQTTPEFHLNGYGTKLLSSIFGI